LDLNGSLNEFSLEKLIFFAQQGNTDIQNQLLKQYQPFIVKTTSNVCKRYIDVNQDDEFSIGLTAFNDAIFSFSSQRGSCFLSFAKIVIKRKIIDYIRSKQKYPKVASLDEALEDKQMENQLEIAAVRERYNEQLAIYARREEIRTFNNKLHEYKISITELTKVSPKHRDTRESAIRTARILFADKDLHQYVTEKKRLPIKKLAKEVNLSKKTLEKHRKFILAIFIILSEDFDYLQDYIKEGAR